MLDQGHIAIHSDMAPQLWDLVRNAVDLARTVTLFFLFLFFFFWKVRNYQ